MFVFDTSLIEFFYTIDIVIYDSVDESRSVVAIIIKIVVSFRVEKVGFISNP